MATVQFSTRDSEETSRRILEDAIPTFCLHPSQTRLKVISQRRRHGEGLFQGNDLQKQLRQQVGELNNNDSSDQFVVSLFSFLTSVRFLAADGTELRAQVIRNELQALRGGHLGQESRWEPFVAFVGLQVGNALQRQLHLHNDDNSDGRRVTSTFFSMPSHSRNSWPPNVVRCATGVTLLSMTDALRNSPLLPRATVDVLLNLFREEEGGSFDEPISATLLRFLTLSNRCGLPGEGSSDWSQLAAELASVAFSRFLRSTTTHHSSARLTQFHVPKDVALWKQDTWNAMVTVVPRVGLSTSASFVCGGALMVLRQKWVFWAGCCRSLNSCEGVDFDVQPLPPSELFNAPAGNEGRVREGKGLEVDVMVLLRDLSLDSYQASRAILHRLIGAPLIVLHDLRDALTIAVLVEDDIDSTTRNFLEGWSSALVDILLTEAGSGTVWAELQRVRILTCTSVGKSYMYRIATQLRVAPAPSVLLKHYDGSVLLKRKFGIAVSPHTRRLESSSVPVACQWSIAFELAGTVSHDATTYSSWHGSAPAKELLVSVSLPCAAETLSNTTESLASTFVSVVLCATTSAVVDALTFHFFRHVAALRSLFSMSSPSGGAQSDQATCCPGHGLPLALMSSVCLGMANDVASANPCTTTALQQWKRQYLLSRHSASDDSVAVELDRDVLLVLPIVAKAFYDAITSYLALVLEQSLGYSADRALSRAALTTSVLCGVDDKSNISGAGPKVANNFKDMYTLFIDCPPLLAGNAADNDDYCLGRSSELTLHLPTVTLSDCRDWHSVDEVVHAIASAARIVESYTAIGVITASV
jgi:hypothetical protein